jgi:hypothetical protein
MYPFGFSPVHYTLCCSFVLFIILSVVRLSLLVLRPLLAYCTSPRWQAIVIVEKLVEWRLAGATEVLGETLPQPHHKFHMNKTRVRIRAAAVGSQQLTAWAMARPYSFVCIYFKCSAFLILTSPNYRLINTAAPPPENIKTSSKDKRSCKQNSKKHILLFL